MRGKGRKKRKGEGEREGEGGKEVGWLLGSCFLPGSATPSGGVGVGERLQSLSQRGREGEREGGEGGMEGERGTDEKESGGMLYHSLTRTEALLLQVALHIDSTQWVWSSVPLSCFSRKPIL